MSPPAARSTLDSVRSALGSPKDASPAAGNETVYWRSLYYFNLYRLVLASILVTIAISGAQLGSLGERSPRLFLIASLAFFVVGATSLVTITRGSPSFRTQGYVQIAADIILLTLVMHASGSVGSGMGLLLIVSVAAGGVVLSGRMTLFFAALASLAVLLEHAAGVLLGIQAASNFTQAGLLGIGLFTTGLVIYVLARRIRSTEAIAERRAVDLANLGQVNELIVQRLQSGVLVLDSERRIRLMNDRARELLGVAPDTHPVRLEDASRQLAAAEQAWRRDGRGTAEPLRTHVRGPSVIPHFVPLTEGGEGLVVYLDDVTLMEEQAVQMKMAALGRLTGAIAHEIRNPLGAISHATQLLDESRLSQDDHRLMQIIQDHSVRLNRIVEDVLQLGRGGTGQALNLELVAWLEDFRRSQEGTGTFAPGQLVIEGPDVEVLINPDHLYQVVLNLCQNAVRHGEGVARVWLRTGVDADGAPYLDIEDRGKGIPPENRDKLFEPFFTTHSRGTGLGLFISREFCQANRAQLDYFPVDTGGSRFRITFPGVDTWRGSRAAGYSGAHGPN